VTSLPGAIPWRHGSSQTRSIAGRRNLGVETIDVYYLHNPETQFGRGAGEMFNSRVREAFEFLESAVARRENSLLRNGHVERVSPGRE